MLPRGLGLGLGLGLTLNRVSFRVMVDISVCVRAWIMVIKLAIPLCKLLGTDARPYYYSRLFTGSKMVTLCQPRTTGCYECIFYNMDSCNWLDGPGIREIRTSR